MKKLSILFFWGILLSSLFGQTVWNEPVRIAASFDKKINCFVSSENGGLLVYHELNDNMDFDLFLQKTDLNGNFSSENPISLFNNELQQKDAKMAKSSDNQYFVTWCEINNNQQTDLYLMKVNENGQFLWESRIRVGTCNDYETLKDIRIIPDNNGGTYIVWIESTTATSETIFYNRIDTNGIIEFSDSGFEWYSHVSLSFVSSSIIGEGLSVIVSSNSTSSMIYLSTLIPESEVFLQQSGVFWDNQYQIIQFDNQHSIVVQNMNDSSSLIILDEDFQIINQCNINGALLYLSKLNENQFYVITIEYPGNFMFYKFEQSGDLIFFSNYSVSYEDFPLFFWSPLISNDKIYFTEDHLYFSVYAFTSGEFGYPNYNYFLIDHNLTDHNTQIKEIANLDNNQFKSFSAFNNTSFMIYNYHHYSPENYYSFNRIDFNNLNNVISSPTQFLSGLNQKITNYNSASAFSKNYLTVKTDNRFNLYKCNTEGNNNLISSSSVSPFRYSLKQISEDHLLLMYLLHSTYVDLPLDFYNYTFKVLNSDDELLSSNISGINNSNLEVFSEVLNDYTWLSYREEDSNYNMLRKIESGSFTFGDIYLENAVIIGTYQNYVLFRKEGILKLTKLNQTGYFADGWTEEGIGLQNSINNSSFKNAVFQMYNDELLIAWVEVTGSIRKMTMQKLNPDSGELISSGSFSLSYNGIPDLILANNHIFIITNINNSLNIRRFDLNSNQLDLIFNKLIAENVSTWHIQKKDNRFIIAYQTQIDNCNKVFLKTLSFEGYGDQFTDGWELPNVYLHQEKPQIVLTENNQAFVNRLEYNQQNEKALVCDLVNLNEFVSSDNPNEPSIKQTTLDIYPNPFNPSTTIKWIQAKSGQTSISIYNIKGQKVQNLYSGFSNQGEHQMIWEAKELSSGIYFVKISSNHETLVKKAIIIK